jgi:methionyl-tRNA formyltransferase
MKSVFLGTPEFAVPTLEAMVSAGLEVQAVFTQPDRPKGRGQELAFSPVKQAALRLGLPVMQPLKVRVAEVVEQLRSLAPRVMVVVGYGQIIPQSIIDIPPLGIVNVHASLLPKYRGAAPIQWAIAHGETVTGVTTMQIDVGLDTGAMLLKAETEIGHGETALDVGPRLAGIGARLLIETLRRLDNGDLEPVPQDNADASWAPILTREHGLVDWSQPPAVIANKARGFLPWPGAWTWFRGKRMNLWRVAPAEVESPASPGFLFSSGKRLLAACGQGRTLEILELQQEGRKRLHAEAFLNGMRLQPDDILGVVPQ